MNRDMTATTKPTHILFLMAKQPIKPDSRPEHQSLVIDGTLSETSAKEISGIVNIINSMVKMVSFIIFLHIMAKLSGLLRSAGTSELSGWPPKLPASAPPCFFQSAGVFC